MKYEFPTIKAEFFIRKDDFLTKQFNFPQKDDFDKIVEFPTQNHEFSA